MAGKEREVYVMNKIYPNVTSLFEGKAAWRELAAARPIEEKIKVVEQLKNFSQKIDKPTAKQLTKVEDK
jgi:hypothetical protein